MTWIGNVVRECPVCSSSDFINAGKRKDSAKVSKCRNCGVGFLNPMPTDREIQEMYSDYYARNDGIGYSGYRSIPPVIITRVIPQANMP